MTGRAATLKRKRSVQKSLVMHSDTRPTIADELRPKTFDQLTFSPQLDQQLVELARNSRHDMPNLLFYGPKGSGKRTRAHVLLSSLFTPRKAVSVSSKDGGDLEETVLGGERSVIDQTSRHRTLHVDCSYTSRAKVPSNNNALLTAGERVFGAKSSASGGGNSGGGYSSSSGTNSVEVTCVESPFHIEITPSDVERKDVYVIQSCVRHLVQTAMPLDLIEKVTQCSMDRRDFPGYRVVLINGADRLHFEAQAAMRRFMEAGVCRVRFILIAEQISRLIPALRSRCLPIRVPAPKDSTIAASLNNVAGYLHIGGRFGGDRSQWSVPRNRMASTHFNDANNGAQLPYPTAFMLVKASRGDYTYAQLLTIANVPTDEHREALKKLLKQKSQNEARRKHQSNRAPSKQQEKKEATFTVALSDARQRAMKLVERNVIKEPSWVETVKLAARVIVLGYAAVKDNEPLIKAWGNVSFGPHTYEKPMLAWLRRVVHELISRCTPLRRCLHQFLASMQHNIEYLCEATENGTKQPRIAAERHLHFATPDVGVWSEERCETLLERVIELFAAFQCRLAAPFRAVMQLDPLIVHLSDAVEHHRANRPLPDADEAVPRMY